MPSVAPSGGKSRVQINSTMRFTIRFVVTWATASLLLLWLGDHNLYVKYPNGSMQLKDTLTFSGRMLDSMLFAALYSLINTALLKWSEASNQPPSRQATPSGSS